MGQTAQKIIKTDKEKLLKILNEAFAEEWLAYYQYWVGAQVASGITRETVIKEFEEHAKEELEHAKELSERIIQLGGTPLVDPDMWKKQANCKYAAPKDDDVLVLLKQNLDAERCAIKRYQMIMDMCAGKDPITFHIARHILQEEVEHEQEIEDMIEDIESFIKKYVKNSSKK